MAIGLEQFTPETFAQANPFLAGLSNAWQTMGEYGQMQQQLAQGQLQQAQAQYAQPSALAALQQAQNQATNTAAQTAYYQQGLTPEAMAQAGYISGAQTQQAQAQAAQAQGQARVSNLQANNPALLMTSPIAAAVGQIAMLQPGGTIQPGSIPGAVNQLLQPSAAAPGSAPPNPGAYQKIPGGLNGWPQVPTPPGVGQGAPNNSTAPAVVQNNQSPLAAAISHYQQIMANQAGYQTNAQQNITGWNQAQAQAADEAKQAAIMQKNLNDYKLGRSQSTLTGPFEGEFPSNWSGSIAKKALDNNGDISAEQNTDRAANNLATNTAGMIQHNATVYGLKIAPLLKPTRNLADGASQQAVDSTQAWIDRTQEHQTFLNAARQLGVPNKNIAETLFNQYQIDRPPVDPNTGLINQKYKGTFRDYLTPTTIGQATAGQPITATPVQEDLKHYGAMAQTGGAANVQMPSFNNAQEFQSWYGQQSPAQQAAVRRQLGGG